jgi:HlyD family secretion protein
VVLLEIVELDWVVKEGYVPKVQPTRIGSPLSGFLLALVSATLVFQGCSSVAPAKDDTALAAAPQPAKVSAPSTPARTSDEAYVATGPIVVENQVDVLAQREGLIRQIFVDVGASVQKGTLLAQLDDTELSAMHDAAEAKVHSCEADLKDWQAETKVAEVDLKRAQEMAKAGVNTQEQVDHARYKFEGSQYEIEKAQRNLENAKADLRVEEVELGKTRIEAPFSGVVARRYVGAGQKVASGDRLFWVSQLAPLRVRFTVAEGYMREVKKGGTVYVTSAVVPGAVYPAKVLQISPVLDPASDSVDVMAELEGTPTDLRPGMTAHIALTAPAKSQ